MSVSAAAPLPGLEVSDSPSWDDEPASTTGRKRITSGVALRPLGLFFAGVVTISGHVGLGLGLLGPLSALPTLALGITALLFLMLLPGRNGGGSGLLAVLAAFVIASPGFLFAGSHEYATDKVSAMFTIVLPLLLSVSFLARAPQDLNSFWRGVYGLAVFGVLVAFVDLVSGVDIGARGSDVDSLLNPIAAGRLAGTVVLWTLFGRVRRITGLGRAALVLMSLAVLLSAASRGPLLALLIALGLTGLGFRALRGKMLVGAVVAGVALIVGVGNLVLAESGDRILAGGDEGGTGSRSFLWGQAIDAIKVWPEGIGWGQYSAEGKIGAAAEYPHNFLLELAMEAGVIAGICFLLFFVMVLRKLWFEMERVGPQHFALLVFWFVTAMFSSDMNGNRVLVIALFATFAAFRHELADEKRQHELFDPLIEPHPLVDPYVQTGVAGSFPTTRQWRASHGRP